MKKLNLNLYNFRYDRNGTQLLVQPRHVLLELQGLFVVAIPHASLGQLRQLQNL